MLLTFRFVHAMGLLCNSFKLSNRLSASPRAIGQVNYSTASHKKHIHRHEDTSRASSRPTKRIYTVPAPSSLDLFSKLHLANEPDEAPKVSNTKVNMLADKILALSLLETAHLCELYVEAMQASQSNNQPPIGGECLPVPHPGSFFPHHTTSGMLAPMVFDNSASSGTPDRNEISASTSTNVVSQSQISLNSTSETRISSSPSQKTESTINDSKKSLCLRLEGFDAAKKIALIREVKSLLSIGLKEAKELVESTPQLIRKGLSYSEGNEWKKKLETLGGRVILD